MEMLMSTSSNDIFSPCKNKVEGEVMGSGPLVCNYQLKRSLMESNWLVQRIRVIFWEKWYLKHLGWTDLCFMYLFST
jgi:hypothetical protein